MKKKSFVNSFLEKKYFDVSNSNYWIFLNLKKAKKNNSFQILPLLSALNDSKFWERPRQALHKLDSG